MALTINKVHGASADTLNDDSSAMPFGEPTKHGWHILPDNNPYAYGPIYLAVISRVGASVATDDQEEESSGSEEEDGVEE